MALYTTPAAIRARLGGYAAWTDLLLNPKIERASRFIDYVTGWFFEPRDMVLKLDGTATQTLLVPLPIINITKIELTDWPTIPASVSEVQLDSVAVYNRHMTEGRVNPDDRKNPKVAFIGTTVPGQRKLLFNELWLQGKQNTWLTGKFGFTEPDLDAGRSIATDAGDAITAPSAIKMVNGAFTQEDVGKTITIVGSASNDGAYIIATVVDAQNVTITTDALTTEGDGFTATMSTFPQWGVTPWGIQEACELLVLRDLPSTPGTGIGGPSDGAWYESTMRAQGRVVRERVRDQEIQFAAPGAFDGNTMGVITGDPIIDMYLLDHSRPKQMRAV